MAKKFWSHPSIGCALIEDDFGFGAALSLADPPYSLRGLISLCCGCAQLGTTSTWLETMNRRYALQVADSEFAGLRR